jgi:K+/H+ antiporter YhaU regulatory subunit KhtT
MEEAGLRTRTGANVLSIILGVKQHVVDWSTDLRMEADDILGALGRKEQLKAVAQLAGDPRFD